jgi:hypothetical protein
MTHLLALQFSTNEVESVLEDLDFRVPAPPPIILKNCASAFAYPLPLIRFHTLLRYSRKVGITTLKTLVPSTWLHEEPIDDNEHIGVCIFRAEFN